MTIDEMRKLGTDKQFFCSELVDLHAGILDHLESQSKELTNLVGILTRSSQRIAKLEKQSACSCNSFSGTVTITPASESGEHPAETASDWVEKYIRPVPGNRHAMVIGGYFVGGLMGEANEAIKVQRSELRTLAAGQIAVVASPPADWLDAFITPIGHSEILIAGFVSAPFTDSSVRDARLRLTKEHIRQHVDAATKAITERAIALANERDELRTRLSNLRDLYAVAAEMPAIDKVRFESSPERVPNAKAD